MLWVTTSISSLYGSNDLSILLHSAVECLPTSQYVRRLHVQPTASLKTIFGPGGEWAKQHIRI